MSNKIVAVAGLTGRFAQLLAGHLLAKPNITIHGIARNPSKLPETLTSNPRVKVFQAAASDEAAVRTAVSGAAIAICCYLGDNDFMVQSQKTMIDACIAESVPRYMASDWCFDYRKINLGDHPAKDPMKHIAAYLQGKEGQIKGVHVLNGAFMEVIFNPGQWDASANTMTIWGDGNDKMEMTTYSDAAAYSAEIAADGNASGFICFRGDFLTYHDMMQRFKDIYGISPTLKSKGTLDECNQTARNNLKKDPGNIWGWIPMLYSYWVLNGRAYMPDDELANDGYPAVKPTKFHQLLQAYPHESLRNVAVGIRGGSVTVQK